MSDSVDPDADFKVELCRQLAIVINDRVPGIPGGAGRIVEHLLVGLRGELIKDEIDRRPDRRATDDAVRALSRFAFGRLHVFGEPIDKALEGGKRRRRILNAALVIAAEEEQFFSELLAAPPWEPFAATNAIERRTERIVSTRQRARLGIRLFSYAAAMVAWAIVVFTPVTWHYGVFFTVGLIGGQWWAIRHFDPHDHR
jgi:hypothetical protein